MSLLAELEAPGSEREAKREIRGAICATAERLGNTVTVCRSFYVHPAVIDAYREGWIRETVRSTSSPERALTALLESAESSARKSA
jgi:DNA topoisomerase-1